MVRSPISFTLTTRSFGLFWHKQNTQLDPEQKVPSIKAMHKYGRIRRRDGAFRWGIFQDLEDPDRYIETFLVNSWAENARQHERTTRADREVEDRAHSYIRSTPTVRHLLCVTTKP